MFMWLFVILCCAFIARYRRSLLYTIAQVHLLFRSMHREFHQQQDW